MTHKTVTATDAKLQFGALAAKVKKGTPIIVEKNKEIQMVWISIDDYEDFLEVRDSHFQKNLEKECRQMRKGRHGTLDTLYKIHRDTIAKEAH